MFNRIVEYVRVSPHYEASRVPLLWILTNYSLAERPASPVRGLQPNPDAATSEETSRAQGLRRVVPFRNEAISELNGRTPRGFLRSTAGAAMIRASMNRSGLFANRRLADAMGILQHRLLPIPLVGLFLWMLLPPSSLNAQEDLQSFLDHLMRGRRGAAILSDPQTGEILAVWNAKAAFGRAYPPGSTAKLVESAGLLQEGKVSSADHLYCRRVPELLGESHHCTHPFVGFPFDLKTALAYSCNYFFSAMSVRLPASSLAHWYGVFGFGTPVEGWGSKANPGRVRIPEDAGRKARAALGEDTVLVTPAQLLLAYSAIATRGNVFRLWRSGGPVNDPPRLLRELELRAETFDALNEGFEGCVRSGTCQEAAVPGIRVAGKTGTATAINLHGPTHAWFVGYAPSNSPEIALVVFLERGTGAHDAAPLAGEILRHHFQSERRKP